MKKIHLYHIVSLLFAIAISSASMGQQAYREIRFGDLLIENGAEGYSSIALAGCNSWNWEVGAPELPLLQWVVEMERGATIDYRITDSILIQLEEGVQIRPAQPSLSKNSGREAWQIDYERYGRNEFYGLPLMDLKPLGVMGRSGIGRITISPVRYNPVSGQLIVYTGIEYRIEGLAQRKKMEDEALYVAVVPRQYELGVEPLLQWREQLGFEVRRIVAMGNNRDSIKGVLQEMYERGEVPTYILLVGDVEELSSYTGRYAVEGLENNLSDMYYGEFTKDWYPESMVGRLSVHDTAELRGVVEKLIRYEQNPDTMALRRALIVAGKEDRTPAPTTTNGQVNYVGGRVATVSDTICLRNPESAGMKDSIAMALRRGMGFVNYTAHCEIDRWEGPTITGDELDSIARAEGIWINNCCQSNQFGGDCLGEKLLRQAQGGGVGVIGASNETFWVEDYYWSIGAKMPIALYPQYDSNYLGATDYLLKGVSMGEILRGGNMAVTAVGSPYEAYYWEIYCLMGDPATMPYNGATSRLASTEIEGLHIGMGELDVSGVAGACVTLWQGGKRIGRCRLDGMGNGNMALSEGVAEGELIVTSSKGGYIPRIDTLTPQRPEGEWLMMELIADKDSIAKGEVVRVGMVGKNVGTDTVRNHQIKLCQHEEDLEGAQLDSCYTMDIAQLGPMESDTLWVPIEIKNLGQLPILKMHLDASDNGVIYNSLGVEWRVNRSELKEDFKIHKNDIPVTRLEPHRTYSIAWRLENTTPYPIENIDARIEVVSYPNGEVQTTDIRGEMGGNDYNTFRTDFTTENTLQGVWIKRRLTYDGTTIEEKRWWIAGNAKEDFEGDGLENYPWENRSLVPWKLDSTDSHSGRYSMRSGEIGDHQRCDLELWVEVSENDTIGFWYKVRSESKKDLLYFCVNNRTWLFSSGLQEWKYWSMELPKGRYRLTWRYQKDQAGALDADAAWIDDIRLPFSEWSEICGPMDTLIYEEPEEIETIDHNAMWSCSPNPARNYIQIESSQRGRVELWDCMGRKIEEFEIENRGVAQYSVAHLRFGLYLLVFTNEKGSSTKKLMITP